MQVFERFPDRRLERGTSHDHEAGMTVLYIKPEVTDRDGNVVEVVG
jgi:hypothetical protein